jgi:GT2 family glycosyltransferase
MSNKTIAVVILNWNGINFLKQFLSSFAQHSAVEGFDSSIVVVDNGSTDNSVKWIRSEFPSVRLIVLDKNYGFTGGYNIALKQVSADYYVIVNSDVKVDRGWLNPLVNFLEENPKAAACQPKILSFNEPHKFEYAGASGGFVDFLGYPFCRGRILSVTEEDKGQYDNTHRVFWATGACMVIKSKAFWEVGGFDTNFFAHMEEIDLCWRLNRLGYSIWVVPQSSVLHVGGGTLPNNNPFKVYLNHRNNLLMLHKNLFGARLFLTLSFRMVLDLASSVLYALSGNFSFTLSVYKAHFYFLKSLKRNAYKKSKCKENTKSKTFLYPYCILFQYFICKKRMYFQLPKTE